MPLRVPPHLVLLLGCSCLVWSSDGSSFGSTKKTNDPLRYLRGKSWEDIHQILHPLVYEIPSKDSRQSKRKTQPTHRKP
jgi:hypothetical protein